MLTVAEVMPTASSPLTAARRPARPPATAKPAAMAIQMREKFAACDSRRAGSSSNGVVVDATAV